jgi:hypothetical protein
MPAVHCDAVHVALVKQQAASVVPAAPSLLGSKYLLAAGQILLIWPPHLVVSCVQQRVVSAAAVQVLPAHSELETAVFSFLPAGHVVIVEHAALLVQQVATAPSANTPYLVVSL